MLDTRGQLSLKIEGVTNSNGICWNEEATVMYYIDTPTKKVMAYCYEDEVGSVAQPSMVADTGDLGLEGSPDGMTIDAEGMLWVAMCHGGLVVRINPHGGKLIQQVELPCIETTACAFGGDSLGRLFVTTGIHKSLDEENAGKVFAIDGLAVGGVPAFAFKGVL
jgi:sugar lactone lactonase YvrE